MSKLLLIEDNLSLASRLQLQLSDVFMVSHASTGTTGLQQIRSGSYDLVILDLTLPDMSGYDVCHIAREEGIQIPILILTGVDELVTRVKLLNAGADDYLTKPFSFTELEARLQALLRRSYSDYNPHILSIDDLILDTRRRSAMRGDVSIKLRRKEFDILEYLVRNRGRIVTRAMIIDHVWESSKESWQNTVDVHIKHLRDKVDRPFAESLPLIHTAYGIGYLVDDKQPIKKGVTIP